MKSEKSEFEPYVQYLPKNDPKATSEDYLKVMSLRRSIRDFSTRHVDLKIVENAIRCAGTAPSGANKQPWFFAVITNSEVKKKIRSAAEVVEAEFYQSKAPDEWINDLKPFGTSPRKAYLSHAPVLIGVFSRTQTDEADGRYSKTYYPIESTCVATGLLISSLHMSGLSTLTHTPRPLNFLNQILELDESYRPLIILVTGYPGENTVVPKIEKKSLEKIMRYY